MQLTRNHAKPSDGGLLVRVMLRLCCRPWSQFAAASRPFSACNDALRFLGRHLRSDGTSQRLTSTGPPAGRAKVAHQNLGPGISGKGQSSLHSELRLCIAVPDFLSEQELAVVHDAVPWLCSTIRSLEQKHAWHMSVPCL